MTASRCGHDHCVETASGMHYSFPEAVYVVNRVPVAGSGNLDNPHGLLLQAARVAETLTT
jgi:hypothetical protein